MKLFEIKMLKEAYKESIKTDEDAIKMVLEHCKDALNTINKPIVRGMNDSGKYVKITGWDGERASRNTTNHYTTILDSVLPPGYPERSKSIICINYDGVNYAENFGDVYAILPFDGVKIGVCRDHDIWETLVTIGKTEKTITDWNDQFSALGLNEEYYKDFIHDLEQAIEDDRSSHEDPDDWTIAHDLRDIEDLDEAIREGYAEQFQLATTAKSFEYNDGGVHELWIGGPCVAIRLEDFDEFKELLATYQR